MNKERKKSFATLEARKYKRECYLVEMGNDL
jgi:hypothetical protein